MMILIMLLGTYDYHVSTDKAVYQSGEQVKMEFVLTNPTAEAIDVACEHTPEYNFWIEQQGVTIWQQFDTFTPGGPSYTIEPGEVLTYNAEWTAEPGSYYAVGGTLLKTIAAARQQLEWTTDYVDITVLPEPATIMLMVLGLMGLCRRR